MVMKNLVLALLISSMLFVSIASTENVEDSIKTEVDDSLNVNDEVKDKKSEDAFEGLGENLNMDDLKSMFEGAAAADADELAAEANESEQEMINSIIIEMGLDKKEKLTKEDFRAFLIKLMSKDFTGNPEEEEFMNFIVEKAVASVPEEFSLEELREFVGSDKLRKILEEAISEKFGLNFNDLLGSMTGNLDPENNEIPNLDDLENIQDLDQQNIEESAKEAPTETTKEESEAKASSTEDL
jgi:hypothetical protein